MSLSRKIARLLMRWTTRRPPPDRAEWALAMERDFETLERGELGWALGCAVTMAGWKLRANWLYLLLLLSAPLLDLAESHLEFTLLLNRDIPRSFVFDYGPLTALLTPLPLALLLGAYRPRSIVTTLLVGCVLVQHVGGTLYASVTLGHPFLSLWGPHATIYMMPPLLGLCASLAVWFIGAGSGAMLVKRAAAR